ncbi:MAG: hypothetical protein AB1Z98_02675 [Nannocystaceae bacterium]
MVLAALTLACSGGDANTSTSASSVGPGGSTTDPDPGSSGSTSSGSPQTSSGTTTDDPPGDGSGTTDASDTSTDDGCIPGTEGCSCDAGACDTDLICLGDTCVALQCDGDVFEANDDESTAYFLGMIDDDDDNGGIVSASLNYPGDVDWFSYQGDDDFLSNVDPARELVSSAGLRLCKFIECDNGLENTVFECPAGTDYAFSPEGRVGCCSSGGIALDDLNCSGVTEDNAMVYLRIDQPAEDCVTYSVSYHY